MSNRVVIKDVDPAAYKAMLSLEKYLGDTELDPIHKELIKLRASQINGCAYCLNMHSKDARKLGETEQRLYVLSAWKDTTLFTEEEQAILALTEEVTLIQGRVSDKVYNRALELLGEKYLAQVIMAIVTINAWNRISISSETKVGASASTVA
jgi:AhpD family alkylhydroperoxidase